VDEADDDDDSPGPRPVGFAFYGLYPILIAAVRLFSFSSGFSGVDFLHIHVHVHLYF